MRLLPDGPALKPVPRAGGYRSATASVWARTACMQAAQ